MTRLTDEERQRFTDSAPGWSTIGETISKTYVLEDFNAALGLVVSIGMLAEAADHHPDIDIRWNKVTVALTTHEEGGLTGKDTALAVGIDALEPHLLGEAPGSHDQSGRGKGN